MTEQVKKKPEKLHKAHWVNSFVLDIYGSMRAVQCSKCGFKTTYFDYKYCPACETKMEEAK